jgi:hypothetical protein
VTAAAHGHRYTRRAGEFDGGDYIIFTGAAYDNRRITVNHAVPNATGLIVSIVSRANDLTRHAPFQCLYVSFW